MATTGSLAGRQAAFAAALNRNSELQAGAKQIDIAAEIGRPSRKLQSQNQNLGDALDDITGTKRDANRLNTNTRTVPRTNKTQQNNRTNNNTADGQGFSTSLLASEDVSIVFKDVKMRDENYGYDGNQIFDLLDALGESDEDFDLEELFTDKDVFKSANDNYGNPELTFNEFKSFDYDKFGFDLGFAIDFDKETDQLSLIFPNGDNTYQYGNEDGDEINVTASPDNSGRSNNRGRFENNGRSNGTERSDRTESSGKNRRKRRSKRINHTGNARRKRRIKKLFKNFDGNIGEGVSSKGKSIGAFISNMLDSDKNFRIGKLFKNERFFDRMFEKFGDDSQMSHEEFKNHDFSELDADLGVAIRFEEGVDGKRDNLDLNFVEEEVEVEDDDEVEDYDDFEIDDDDNEVADDD